MRIALVIGCSAGKTVEPSARIQDAPVGVTPIEWMKMLRGPLTPAADLYTGESFRRLRAIAEKIGADLLIASAGLGVIRATRCVPSYEASFSNEVDIRVKDRFTGSNAEWLQGLTALYNEAFSYDLVIAAVPDGYEEAVSITLGQDVLFITARKKNPRAIVYDRRLNDPRCPYRGRDSDFKVRAMEHYVDNVFPATDQSALDLSMYDERKRLVRPALTDEQVVSYLRDNETTSVSAAYAKILEAGFAIGIKRLRRIYEAL